MAEEKKVQWGVPSQLENINSHYNVVVSYLDFNKEKVKEKFGERSEEIMSVLDEVKSWLNDESEIMHKKLASVLAKIQSSN